VSDPDLKLGAFFLESLIEKLMNRITVGNDYFLFVIKSREREKKLRGRLAQFTSGGTRHTYTKTWWCQEKKLMSSSGSFSFESFFKVYMGA
jgi:hypothetical protein